MSWRLMNDHMMVWKATCNSSEASETSSSKNNPVDLRSKRKSRGKNPDKSFTPLSTDFLKKKKKKLPNNIVAMYYVLSLFTDSLLVLQSFHLWLVCVSSMNGMTYLFKYDSFPCHKDTEQWLILNSGVWVGQFFFCCYCSSPEEEKNPMGKKTKMKTSFGFSYRIMILMTG